MILADMCGRVLFLATKRRDPLVTELESKGWVVTDDVHQIPLLEDGTPMHRKVIIWPAAGARTTQREREKQQAAAIRKTLDYAERQGKWAVVADETMWLTRNLGLERELESLWFQGRTAGVSVIASAQRPSHVPLLAFSQADYLFLWQSADRRDIERLREISAGLPLAVVEENVRSLDFRKHEFLFVDVRNREFARSVAPPL